MDFEDLVNVRNGDGRNGISLEAILNGGRFRVKDTKGRPAAELAVGVNVAVLTLGGTEFDGHITINNAADKPSIVLGGRDGDIVLNGPDGKQTVRLSGGLGDVILSGADAAEDFEIRAEDAGVPPGTVMVIDEDGRLRESTTAYDRCVAGVISGAGDYRPGVVLGRVPGRERHRPVALVGKVFCRVTAVAMPIAVGDSLTSSPVRGCAMRAGDRRLSHGAVLGKALAPLRAGQGEIPILVALQ